MKGALGIPRGFLSSEKIALAFEVIVMTCVEVVVVKVVDDRVQAPVALSASADRTFNSLME
jgi:hypothetical protein